MDTDLGSDFTFLWGERLLRELREFTRIPICEEFEISDFIYADVMCGRPPYTIWHDKAQPGEKSKAQDPKSFRGGYTPGARVGKGWKLVAVEEFRHEGAWACGPQQFDPHEHVGIIPLLWICVRCCGSQSRGPIFGTRCIFGFYSHFNREEKLTVMFYVEGTKPVEVRTPIFRKRARKERFVMCDE